VQVGRRRSVTILARQGAATRGPLVSFRQRVPERPMKDKQFEKLMKKTMEQAAKPKAKDRPTYDPTLEATRRPEAGNQAETEEFFSEMKRREF
jgi:hypothetical protein